MTETRLDELTRISIHALREESDGVVGAHYQKVKDFYPRPPRGGRRRVLQYRASLEDISIHALREEGDEDRLDYYVPQFAFLSTPSARRATLPPCGSVARPLYFYPRPPRGGRHHNSKR